MENFMAEQLDYLLTNDEFLSPQGCGAGTENACYALALGPEGTECMIASQSPALDMAGIRLGWRMNIDPTDQRPWCPKGLLPVSKTVELQQLPDSTTHAD